MQNLNPNQVTQWINNAPPAEVIQVTKQALSRISTLSPDDRERFTREVGNDQTVAKLFKADA